MTTPIVEAKKVIESLPQDSTYDEIKEKLVFDKMIKKGLEDSKNSKTISNQEMKNRIKQW